MDGLITPEEIYKLNPNEIFVFGSNLSGFHSGGAALLAYKNFGAIYGQAKGLQGESYAIPTKSEFIRYTLTIPEIKLYVDEFISFVKENRHLTFYVTKIGCGLAGIDINLIAPLFIELKNESNVALPLDFRQIYKQQTILF